MVYVQIELCWDGVSNAACVDEFKVDVELWKEDSRFFFDFPQETSKGGCITIQNLENDKEYEFSVQVSAALPAELRLGMSPV